jgi:CubicO group peptidase (beta-lactamase class C family)
VLALAGALVYAMRVAGILVAYKAKQLCSGVFVGGRDAGAVITELEVDDLELLRYIGSSVDPARKSASATAFGLITREAIYRGPAGCGLVFGGPAPAVSTPFPASAAADAIEYASSERLAAVLDRAFAEPDQARPQRTRAVVVVQSGRVVGERYAAGIDRDTPLIGWSMTKSVMNALAGILVRQGRLFLDNPVPIREWQAPDDSRRGITFDHLLRMSSGLRFDEEMTTPLTDVVYMLLAVPDMAAYAAGKPLDAAPGTSWQYSSGTTVILARAIRNVIADDREYHAFPRRALFDRLGMSSAVLETDAAGTFAGSSLMYATARDWARLGMLYLQDGVWNGERILPEGWVDYTRTPAPADASRRYGAHFWLDVPDGYRRTGATLPRDAFHAAGHQGQFVTVVPSRDAVVVRLGGTRHRDAWDQTAFVHDVLAALEDEAEQGDHEPQRHRDTETESWISFSVTL